MVTYKISGQTICIFISFPCLEIVKARYSSLVYWMKNYYFCLHFDYTALLVGNGDTLCNGNC